MSSSSPLEPLNLPPFFIDRSLGYETLARALGACGLTVHVHDDHFPPDTRDENWLREVGRRQWVVLTKDKMIRYRQIELAALRGASVRAFVLTSGSLDAATMAAAFIKALPGMQRLLKHQRGGFIAKVTRGGAVELIDPPLAR